VGRLIVAIIAAGIIVTVVGGLLWERFSTKSPSTDPKCALVGGRVYCLSEGTYKPVTPVPPNPEGLVPKPMKDKP
jgi:hypothetical protein